MAIRCAVFDADGTLLDSMPMWRDITYEYAACKGISAPEGLHRTLNRLSMEQCAEYCRSLGVSGTTEQVLAELEDWAYRGYCDRVQPKPYAQEFVRLLRENGIQIAVATASYGDGVRKALERCGIFSYVDFFITCTEVGKGKEHPDIFLRCAENCGAVPAETVVFEDSAYALRTAREAGFATVAVADSISMDGGTEEETAAGIAALADRCVSDYGELIRELTELREEKDSCPNFEKNT